MLAPIVERFKVCPACEAVKHFGTMTRVWLGRANAVIGDEIDVTIRNGLCDPVTREPRRFRSRQELAREAKRRGMTNTVEHVGTNGGDRSKHTTRWV